MSFGVKESFDLKGIHALDSRVEERFEMLERVKASTVAILFSRGKEGAPKDLGSGFFLKNGLIMTAAHVAIIGLQRGMETTITLASGKKVAADIEYIDAGCDAAFLKPRLKAGDVVPAGLEFADSGSLAVGQEVWAVGTPMNPFFQGVALPGSIVLVPGARTPDDSPDVSLIKGCIITNTGVKGGMSGGPTVDSEGRVVGINTMTIGDQGRSHEGSLSVHTSSREVFALTEHPAFFIEWQRKLFSTINVARDAGTPTEKIFDASIEVFNASFNEYCQAQKLRGATQTGARELILAHVGTPALFRLVFGARRLTAEEMQTYNAKLKDGIGIEMYSSAEIKNAPTRPTR